MPKTDPNTLICGPKDIKCILATHSHITSKNFSCNCLPGCFEMEFHLELSMSPLNPNAKILRQKRLDENNVGLLHIFFRDYYFRGQKKQELITFTEFLCRFKLSNSFISID